MGSMDIFWNTTKQCFYRYVLDTKGDNCLCLQRIQVERLMASVVAFVVTVELIALRGKMTDVARRECQRSAWENRNMLFPRQNVVIPA